MESVLEIITSPWILTWIGAICGHILSVYAKDFEGNIPFLKQIFPNKKKAFYARLNFLLLPLIGTLLAMIILEPTNLKSCIGAGLSWSGSINLFLKKTQEK